ncbi:MAG: hypothetical protein PVJ50_02750 [Desulfobacterales bacterium]|jgi:hypothetical protein
MKQLLDSNLELVVESGFIYVPLLFDPAIDRELRAPLRSGTTPERPGSRNSKAIIEAQGRYFIRTLSLQSLLTNFEKISADSYRQLRNDCLQECFFTPELDGISTDGKLRTILFQVMTYFIKKNRGLERRRLSEEEILDFIGEKMNVPSKYYERAKTFLDTESLRRMLRDLEKQEATTPEPLQSGLLSARELRAWLRKALSAKIVHSEREGLTKTLQVRERFRNIKKKHLGILLYIAAKGSLEIDGFGFSRIDSSDEYLVYKRTGEYILKDYYARSYLFPDCRVAVPTSGALKPIVMETYKHPFLLGHEAGQEICMRRFTPPNKFTAGNIIGGVEKGINALIYGYDSRRRNGIHSLDRKRLHVKSIEFDDYRI